MARSLKSTKSKRAKKETIVFQRGKSEKKPGLFPKINRFITETWKFFVVSFASGLLIIAIVLQIIILIKNMKEEKALSATHAKTVAELKYWQQITSQYNNYRDGYFKVALLEYKLGNEDAARLYLKKTLELDPNFEKALDLEKILNKV